MVWRAPSNCILRFYGPQSLHGLAGEQHSMYSKAPPSNVPRPSLSPSISLSLVLLSLLHCSALIASLLCMWEDLAPARCDGPAALLLVCGSDVDGVRLEKM